MTAEASAMSVRGAGGGKGGGGGRQRAPYEAPNTLRSKSTAYVMDILSEGPIEGFADGLKSVFFDDTPLQNADGSYNFQGVNLALMAGLPDQDAMAAAVSETAAREVPVGQLVSMKMGGVTKSTALGPLTHLRVTLRFPALFIQDRTTGDVTAVAVRIGIELKASTGDWALMVNDVISGKCTSPYEKSWTFPVHGTGPWQIRVKRLDPADNDDDTTIQDKIYWGSFTEILDWKLSYPNTAYIGLALDAETFGSSVPQRTYEIKGLKIAVPENYDPVTRAYATSGPGTTGGVWNGSLSKIAWTDNPAWVFYDLLTNTRYGLGAQIKPAMVDKWAIYEIAQYCDQLVPDGQGGMEPRFAFNGVINTRSEAYSVLQSIAATFRGMVYWGAGTITATQDRPASPVKLVTNANVLEGTFNYEGSGLRARHTVAAVMFSDPLNGYRPDIELIQGKGLGTRGSVPIEIAGMGVSSRTQARRIGRWALDAEENETQLCTYRGGFDQIDVRPGDIVLISDRWWAGARFGGRVVSASLWSVTVDSPVTIDGSTAYLRVTLPDGALEERAVTNGLGSHTVLTLAAPFSQVPGTESVWMMTTSAAAPRPHRVISIAEVDKHIYEISALFHDETKYDRVEQGINRDPPSFSMFPTGAIQPPSEISLEEFQSFASGAVRAMATVSWKHSTDARVRSYTVEVKRSVDPAYTRIGDAFGNSIDVGDITEGAISIRVRAVDALGRSSIWLERTGLTVKGLAWVPDNVTDFNAEMVDGRLRLTWGAVRQHKSVFYRIKYSPSLSSASWPASVVLVDRVDALLFDGPPRDGTYLLKAVSLAGVESETAIVVISTAFELATLNVIATQDEHPDWTGTKVSTTVTGDGLTLAEGQTSGTYTFQTADIGEPSRVRVMPSIVAYGVVDSDIIGSWTTLSDVTQMASGGGEDWSASLEYRATIDDPAEEGWGLWKPFTTAEIEARALQFRLTIASLDGGVTGVEVSDLSIAIDVPDRVEAANDVTIAAAGTAITFTERFHETPALAVTGQDLATGDYWSITSISRTGFTVRFFNAAGTGVERTADWIAKGYGRERAFTSRKHGRATLTGAGAMAAGQPIQAYGAQASLAGGGGSVAAMPRQTHAMTASLTGAGGVNAATPRVKAAASAMVAGAGGLSAWANARMGNASLTGSGSVAAQAKSIVKVSGAIAGAGGVAASPRAVVKMSRALAGAGTLASTPKSVVRPTPAAITGAGSAIAYAAGETVTWDFMQATMPGDPVLTHARSTKGWYFAAPAGGGRPALTEAAIDVATWDWDPAAKYPSNPNPWADGAVAGTPGTLPTNWTVTGVSGVSREIIGNGVENGIPYLEIRIYATSPAGNNYAINPLPSTTYCVAAQNEAWTFEVGLRIVAGSTTGLNYIRLWMAEYNDAGTLQTQGGTSSFMGSLSGSSIYWASYTRTLSDPDTTRVSPHLHVATTTSTACDITLRVYFPHLSRNSAALMTAATAAAYAARNGSSVPLHGLKGLMIRRKTDVLNKNPRAEGASAGTPGTDPTGWIISAAGGLSKETFATANLDGIPRSRVRLYGTASGGDGTQIGTVYAWGDATTGTYGRHTGTTGEQVCVSAFIGILDALPAVKARFVVDEYDGAGNKLGSTAVGAWQTLSRVRSANAEDGFGRLRLWEVFTLAQSGTTTFVVGLEVANGSATTALDFSLLVGVPQVTKTNYPGPISLPTAASPDVSTVERDIVSTAISNVPYDSTNGITLSAEWELMRGTRRQSGNSDVLAFGTHNNNDGFGLTLSDNGTANPFNPVKISGGVFYNVPLSSVQTAHGVSPTLRGAASWSSSRVRRSLRNVSTEYDAAQGGGLPALEGTVIVAGGFTTGTGTGGSDHRQINGWMRRVGFYTMGYGVGGVIDKLPG
jgi:predicted phage tail protein